MFAVVPGLESFFNSTELQYGDEFTKVGIEITNAKTQVREAILDLFNELPRPDP
jgi:hypothetical protein